MAIEANAVAAGGAEAQGFSPHRAASLKVKLQINHLESRMSAERLLPCTLKSQVELVRNQGACILDVRFKFSDAFFDSDLNFSLSSFGVPFHEPQRHTGNSRIRCTAGSVLTALLLPLEVLL